MNIQIVMPAVNEENRVVGVLKELNKKGYKVIVVEDGSKDNTLERLKSIESSNITVLSHKVNLGKGAGLKTGCDYAFDHGADAVVLMDSDGQHSINDLPLFFEKIMSRKYDVVFGSRNLNSGVPLVRYIGNKLASMIVNFMFGIYVSDLLSGFRALTKSAYSKIKWESSGYGVETEMVIRVKKEKLKYCEIPVATIYYDNYKGVSILDAFGVFTNLIYWKFRI